MKNQDYYADATDLLKNVIREELEYIIEFDDGEMHEATLRKIRGEKSKLDNFVDEFFENFEVQKLAEHYADYTLDFLTKHSKIEKDKEIFSKAAMMLLDNIASKLVKDIIMGLRYFSVVGGRTSVQERVNGLNHRLFYGSKEPKFITILLESVFTEYEIVISLSEGKLEIAQKLFDKTRVLEETKEALAKADQTNFNNFELAKNEFIRYRNENEELQGIVKKHNSNNTDKKPSNKLTSFKTKPGRQPKFKSIQELKKAIKQIPNYRELSIRKISKQLKYKGDTGYQLAYKSDSGYRELLKALNLPTDYHKNT